MSRTLNKVDLDSRDVVFELLAEKNDIRSKSRKTGQWEVNATVCIYYNGTTGNEPSWNVVVKTLEDGEWSVVSTFSYERLSSACESFAKMSQVISQVTDGDIIPDDCGDALNEVGYIQMWE